MSFVHKARNEHYADILIIKQYAAINQRKDSCQLVCAHHLCGGLSSQSFEKEEITHLSSYIWFLRWSFSLTLVDTCRDNTVPAFRGCSTNYEQRTKTLDMMLPF